VQHLVLGMANIGHPPFDIESESKAFPAKFAARTFDL
jgi:hypothetical protein